MTENERSEILSLMKEVIQPVLENQAELSSKIDNQSLEIQKINLKLEQETDRAIQILSEGFAPIERRNRQQDAMEDRLTVVEDKVELMTRAIQSK